ncbi:MAG TPA: hypothetical protein VMH26_17310 [Burkholderiales bacterium]|nr:hypothetical protein [Burkholderiales bacterium]
MSKPPPRPGKSRQSAKPLRAPVRNTRLGAQTRKVLTKHYRAKHGVR